MPLTRALGVIPEVVFASVRDATAMRAPPNGDEQVRARRISERSKARLNCMAAAGSSHSGINADLFFKILRGDSRTIPPRPLLLVNPSFQSALP
jgi:hypothetical protein